MTVSGLALPELNSLVLNGESFPFHVRDTAIRDESADCQGLEGRIAGPDDIQSLSAFILEAWREAGPGALGFSGATDEAVHKLASEPLLRVKLTDPALRIFIAEEAGRVVGFASLKRIDSTTAELSGLIVLQSLVGKGVGTELLHIAEEFADMEGYNKMVVKTEAFNDKAIAFYRKLGFVGTTEIEEDVEGTPVRLMVLEKSIS
jgi:ribosomal protein S18 acetylase RimI-like enzyme